MLLLLGKEVGKSIGQKRRKRPSPLFFHLLSTSATTITPTLHFCPNWNFPFLFSPCLLLIHRPLLMLFLVSFFIIPIFFTSKREREPTFAPSFHFCIRRRHSVASSPPHKYTIFFVSVSSPAVVFTKPPVFQDIILYPRTKKNSLKNGKKRRTNERKEKEAERDSRWKEKVDRIFI